MRRTRLLCAIGVSVWSTVMAGSQAAAPAVLSDVLRAHVKDERFGIVTSIRGLPLGVRDGLQTLFGSQTLDIAEPGAEFQVTDVVVDPKLPIRRLVAAGCSTDHCLVYYERGGIAHTWRVALFHWTPAATRFEWGGTAPRGLASIDDVRSAILSGGSKVRPRSGSSSEPNPSAYPRRLKNCTARSCRSAAPRVLNVPRFRRRPVFGSRLREYRRYSPVRSFRIIPSETILTHGRAPRMKVYLQR